MLRRIGNKLVPLLMPTGRLKTIAIGWAGGLAGSWADRLLWQLGPEAGGIYLVGAAIGCVLPILLFGIAPFVRIMLGRV